MSITAPSRFAVYGLFCVLVLLEQVVAAVVVTGEDSQTSLRTWELRETGVSVLLVQRLPNQSRAFFIARGFTSKDANTIGRACIVQAVFRNDGTQPVAYDMDSWHITYRGQRLPVQTREFWQRTWQESDVNQAARIALHWSLLPTQQVFQPGDYNWGMVSFGLAPGEAFDLTLLLSQNNNTVTHMIPDIVCRAEQSSEEP